MRGGAWNVSGGLGVYTGEPDPSGASERGKFGRAANDKLILLPRVRPGMSLIGSTLSVESRVRIYRYFFFFRFVRFVGIPPRIEFHRLK